MFVLLNRQEILPDLADFAFQEQLEAMYWSLFLAAWYNGSYTMAAKRIKSLKLRHTMMLCNQKKNETS